MIIKNAHSKASDLARLEALVARADERQKKLITDELRMMRAGIKGEEESGYLLDFTFANSKYTAVAHDLRLEVGGRVAQIDHLVIHHTHRFYVLETKSFAHGLKINEHGEFLRWNGYTKAYEGMASPVEQNRRHAMVLKEMLERLGYKSPAIECFVLVSSKARIDRPRGNPFPEVVKADQFLTAYQKDLDASLNTVTGFLSGVSKSLLGESPHVLAKKLVEMHRPIRFNFEAKFGIDTDCGNAGKTTAVAPTLQAPIIGRSWGHAVPTPAKSAEAPRSPACKSCSGTSLSVQYGKFGYYFKCRDCDSNTAIKIGCGVETHKERLRKDGLTFYRECADCKTSSVYIANQVGAA